MRSLIVKTLAITAAAFISKAYSVCYWSATATCATDGTTVDYVTFGDTPSSGLAWGSAEIKADGNWVMPNYTTVNQGGYGRAGLTQEEVCYGPAKFVNPQTSATEEITWWKAGSVDSSYQQNFRWKTVDPSSSTSC